MMKSKRGDWVLWEFLVVLSFGIVSGMVVMDAIWENRKDPITIQLDRIEKRLTKHPVKNNLVIDVAKADGKIIEEGNIWEITLPDKAKTGDSIRVLIDGYIYYLPDPPKNGR